MAFNLTEAAKGYLTNAVISKASSMLGEQPDNTQKAMTGAIPLALTGLINRAESPDGGNFLSSLLQQFTGGTASTLPDPDNAADDNRMQGMMTTGSSLISSLFGDKGNLIAGALSQYAGVKSSSASGLMGIAGSILVGLLGRQAATGNLGPSGLMSLLSDQKSAVQGALPSGLGSLLGNIPGIGGLFSGLSGMGAGLAGAGAGLAGAASGTFSDPEPMVSDATRSVAGAGYASSRPVQSDPISSGPIRSDRDDDDRPVATDSGFGKLLPWVLLGLGALALFFMLRGCDNNRPDAASTVNSTTATASDMAADVDADTDSMARAMSDAASDVASDVSAGAGNLGAFVKRKLSSGTELNVPERGIESNLIAFIEDKNKPVDKTTWFNFDRLLFETGSARLTASSQEQVRNMAEILKAYPNVSIKIGGYTDNTGNAAANQKLSADRANAVMNALTGLNVAANRVEAEGYGQQFPVASNDTEAGRAQNRRIAVRVTKK